MTYKQQIADEMAAIDARLRAVPTQLECSAAVNDLLQFMDRNAARVIAALRSPEPAQAEPVAWMYRKGSALHASRNRASIVFPEQDGWTETPLYAHPPAQADQQPPEDVVEAVARAIWGDEAYRPTGWQNAVKAALAIAERERAWQPIETAPAATDKQSGNLRVLVIGGIHREAEIVLTDGEWWRMRAKKGGKGVPTHWQPLPEPPGAAIREQRG